MIVTVNPHIFLLRFVNKQCGLFVNKENCGRGKFIETTKIDMKLKHDKLMQLYNLNLKHG